MNFVEAITSYVSKVIFFKIIPDLENSFQLLNLLWASTCAGGASSVSISSNFKIFTSISKFSDNLKHELCWSNYKLHSSGLFQDHVNILNGSAIEFAVTCQLLLALQVRYFRLIYDFDSDLQVYQTSETWTLMRRLSATFYQETSFNQDNLSIRLQLLNSFQ